MWQLRLPGRGVVFRYPKKMAGAQQCELRRYVQAKSAAYVLHWLNL